MEGESEEEQESAGTGEEEEDGDESDLVTCARVTRGSWQRSHVGAAEKAAEQRAREGPPGGPGEGRSRLPRWNLRPSAGWMWLRAEGCERCDLTGTGSEGGAVVGGRSLGSLRAAQAIGQGWEGSLCLEKEKVATWVAETSTGRAVVSGDKRVPLGS